MDDKGGLGVYRPRDKRKSRDESTVEGFLRTELEGTTTRQGSRHWENVIVEVLPPPKHKTTSESFTDYLGTKLWSR